MNTYVVTKVIIKRPSIANPFKPDYPEMPNGQYKEYIKKTYIETGKILSTNDSLSEDSLTLTIDTVWKNEEERVIYMNDPIVKKHFEWIINYRKSVGISGEWHNKEYRDNVLVREWSGTH